MGETGGGFKQYGGGRVGHRIGRLRESEAQLTGPFQDGLGVNLRVHVRTHAADMAHFVKDSTLLHQQEQQGQT